MGILNKKIWRYIKHNLGQFLATAAVVMAGIMVYIAMSGAYYNLRQARDSFYQENHFADYYFQVVRAPQNVVKQVQMLPGVRQAGGRIQYDVPIVKENEDRATARIVSYQLPMDTQINGISLVQGRFFSAQGNGAQTEVVMDPKYLAANHISWGDQVTVVVNSKKVLLTAVGSAIGPEFIYAMKDSADMMPDPQKFGIFMMEYQQAQQILNMSGQINQVLLTFMPGCDEKQTVEAVKDILEPYGLLTSYARDDQSSHAVLKGELDQLRSITLVMPFIFLSIAAAIQFIILRRMIKSQRPQIGLLKGMGYHNVQIMLHYVSYALAISLTGAVAGEGLGILCSRYFTDVYATYFNLPSDIQGYDFQSIFLGLGMCLLIGAIAGISASRGVMRIRPSQAMRPEPPKNSSRSILEHLPLVWRRLRPGWKMTFRNISRNKGRFTFTLLGIVFAVGLLVISFFMYDAMDYIMQKFFYEGQSYDIVVRFNSLLPEKELLNIQRIAGVQKVEPFMELPVRIHYQGRSEDEVFLAYASDVTMKKVESDTGETVKIPAQGILLNQRTAKKLGLTTGAKVEVETLLSTGPVHKETLEVVGLNRQLIGMGSFINLTQANHLLQEADLVSGAMLKIAPGTEMQVEAELDDMLGIASIVSKQKEIANFAKNLGTMNYSVGIMVLFAAALGFAIVYNSSVINLAERQREIGCMRVTGFSVREISGLLFQENIVYAVLGSILGLPFGRYVAEGYIQSVSSDLYTLPVIIYPRTYILAAVGGMIFILVAHLFSVRGLKKQDLAAVLKSPE